MKHTPGHRRNSILSKASAFAMSLLWMVVVWPSSVMAVDARGNDSRLPQTSSDNDPLQTRIAELIQGLGAESYATRIRCRDELARIGLAAFDQLREASQHIDSEIAIVARRLTSSLSVKWARPNDSPRIQRLLEEYGSKSTRQREVQIRRLGQLPLEESYSALVRLTRFETQPYLASAAALEVMQPDLLQSLPHLTNAQADPHTDDAERQMRAELITKTLQNDTRVSSRWLMQHAQDLINGKVDVERWFGLIESARDQIYQGDESTPEDLDLKLNQLLKLTQITASRAASWQQPEDAIELIVRLVDLVPSRTREVMSVVSWALNQRLYQIIPIIHQEHEKVFRQSPILLYASAEAEQQTGNPDTALRLAQDALAINPIMDSLPNAQPDSKQDDDKKLHPELIEHRAGTHLAIADELVDRGLFQWAEKEYAMVIDTLSIDSLTSAAARVKLANMFGELSDHQKVVDTLAPLKDRIDRDDEFKQRLISRRFNYSIVFSNMSFHQGLLLVQQGQPDGAKPLLRSAFAQHPDNIDILIAMYRVPGDEEWQTSVSKLLAQHTRIADSEVNDVRNSMQRVGPFKPNGNELAEKLNAYAWLVSNTEGDFAKALRYSKESLRLSPQEPALMDTCARCFYANGDLPSAIQMQGRACELMPHSPPMIRQLREFQEEWESSERQTTDSEPKS